MNDARFPLCSAAPRAAAHPISLQRNAARPTASRRSASLGTATQRLFCGFSAPGRSARRNATQLAATPAAAAQLLAPLCLASQRNVSLGTLPSLLTALRRNATHRTATQRTELSYEDR